MSWSSFWGHAIINLTMRTFQGVSWLYFCRSLRLTLDLFLDAVTVGPKSFERFVQLERAVPRETWTLSARVVLTVVRDSALVLPRTDFYGSWVNPPEWDSDISYLISRLPLGKSIQAPELFFFLFLQITKTRPGRADSGCSSIVEAGSTTGNPTLLFSRCFGW